MPGSASHLIGRGGRGGPGGGGGTARVPGRSEKPQQLRAAARVGAGSLRAPAEAMRAPVPGTRGCGGCGGGPAGRAAGAGSRCLLPAPARAPGRLALTAAPGPLTSRRCQGSGVGERGRKERAMLPVGRCSFFDTSGERARAPGARLRSW